jgi:hypothetical protein
MDLRQADLVLVSNADPEELKVDFGKIVPLRDPLSPDRLVEAGLVDKTGKFTDSGKGFYEKLMAKVAVLKGGVPLERRKLGEPKKLLEYECRWNTGTLKKQPYFTNGEVFVIGKPEAAMQTRKGSSELRQAVPNTLRTSLAGDFEEVFPVAWQTLVFGDLEVIWLVNEKQENPVAMQVMYFDYLKKRFPKGKYFVAVEPTASTPIQIRVRNKGIKDNVCALVMPFDIGPAFEVPDFGGLNGDKEVQE